MPTTQPLDEDELGEIAEGPLKPIAGFARAATSAASQPARVATPRPGATAYTNPTSPKPDTSTLRAGTPNQTPGIIAGMRTPGIGLNGKLRNQAPKPQTVQTQPNNSVKQTAYTDEDVTKAWNTFIDNHTSEHLLVNAMRVAEPRREAHDNFSIAQSSVHLKYINENLDRLTNFVRHSVGNDKITFSLVEVSEESPLAWNSRDLVMHMMENNPALKSFIETLKLNVL